MADSEVDALAAASSLNDADLLLITQAGLSKSATLNLATSYFEQRARQHNAAITTQVTGAVDVYIAGTNCLIPTGRVQAKTKYRLEMIITKGAAGTGTPTFNIRVGTAGAVGDTSRVLFTWPAANTAVADEMKVEILCTFQSVGSATTAVIEGNLTAQHRLTTTGFGGTALTQLIQLNTTGGVELDQLGQGGATEAGRRQAVLCGQVPLDDRGGGRPDALEGAEDLDLHLIRDRGVCCWPGEQDPRRVTDRTGCPDPDVERRGASPGCSLGDDHLEPVLRLRLHPSGRDETVGPGDIDVDRTGDLCGDCGVVLPCPLLEVGGREVERGGLGETGLGDQQQVRIVERRCRGEGIDLRVRHRVRRRSVPATPTGW